MTREFELVTRRFKPVTRGFELATRGFKLVTRRFELATRVLLFHKLRVYPHFDFGSNDKFEKIIKAMFFKFFKIQEFSLKFDFTYQEM